MCLGGGSRGGGAHEPGFVKLCIVPQGQLSVGFSIFVLKQQELQHCGVKYSSVGGQMSRLMTKPAKMACAPSEDSDLPGYPPSLI